MAHLANPDRSYYLLQQRLDRNVTGAPDSPAFTQILKLLFSPEDAEIARQIRFLKLRSLNVITNALNIAMELANLPHIRLIMIGGVLRQMSYSLAGPPAEQTLRGLHADRLFLGVDGLDPEIGLMTPDVVEAQLNAVMIQVSREVVVVADASKFQRRSLSVIAKLDVVHKVITDSGTSPEVLQALRARNLEVIVA